MCGEYTVEQISRRLWQCEFIGEPKNIKKIVMAKNKKSAAEIFESHIRAVERRQNE